MKFPSRHPHFISLLKGINLIDKLLIDVRKKICENLTAPSESIPYKSFVIRWHVNRADVKWLVINFVFHVMRNFDFRLLWLYVFFKSVKMYRCTKINSGKKAHGLMLTV